MSLSGLKGGVGINYSKNVFINCPFDKEYRVLFEALVFTIIFYGFEPICARVRVDSGKYRRQKIEELIGDCKLGIHDLSRNGADEHNQLARFNMPFELGLFLGADVFGKKAKACLILVGSPHDYQQYISDIAGQDPEHHGNDSRELIKKVRNFLLGHADNLMGFIIAWEKYSLFKGELPNICKFNGHEREDIHYPDLCVMIKEWLDNA